MSGSKKKLTQQKTISWLYFAVSWKPLWNCGKGSNTLNIQQRASWSWGSGTSVGLHPIKWEYKDTFVTSFHLCKRPYLHEKSVLRVKEYFISQMLAVQPDELPSRLLSQCCDCAAFIIGTSFAFYISCWRFLKHHISPASPLQDAARPGRSNSLWFPVNRDPGRM